jgi:hypothetical protein
MEILSTQLIGQDGVDLFFGITFGIFAALFLVASIAMFSDGGIGEICFGMSIVVAISIGFISVGVIASYTALPITQYEVLITDMNAFDTSKYEIIEQRGKIFVVRESSE